MSLRHVTFKEFEEMLREGDLYHIVFPRSEYDRKDTTVWNYLVEVVYMADNDIDVTVDGLASDDPSTPEPDFDLNMQYFTDERRNLIEEVQPLDLPLYAGYPFLTDRYRELLQEITLDTRSNT